MSLLLSEEKAMELIYAIKHIIKEHRIDVNSSNSGTINLKTFGDRELAIDYNISLNVPGKYSINLRDCKTPYTLLRLNICDDKNFHKNANGERIYGNRISIFSSDEFKEKNDGYTHCRAYKMPYDTLIVHPSFHEMLEAFLEYTKTYKNDKLKINSTKQISFF